MQILMTSDRFKQGWRSIYFFDKCEVWNVDSIYNFFINYLLYDDALAVQYV